MSKTYRTIYTRINNDVGVMCTSMKSFTTTQEAFNSLDPLWSTHTGTKTIVMINTPELMVFFLMHEGNWTLTPQHEVEQLLDRWQHEED